MGEASPAWFTAVFPRLVEGQELPTELLATALEHLMRGDFADWQAASFLTALRMRGETGLELATAARVLRRHMQPLTVRHGPVLDTCGTGGDRQGTFNISTTVALLVAACGVPVVKHGNRAVSSRSGSADVLHALGLPIDAGLSWTARCLEACQFAFCFAPSFHPSMAHVAPVRRQLGIRTLFNLLGPLANPANAEYQLLGVGRAELLEPMAAAVEHLGTRQTLLVHGLDGLDEVSLAAPTRVICIRGSQRQEWRWQVHDFGLTAPPLAALQVDGPEASAAVIRAILRGEAHPGRDIVLANTAAALFTAERVQDVQAGVALAQETIDRGVAQKLLDRLLQIRPE